MALSRSAIFRSLKSSSSLESSVSPLVVATAHAPVQCEVCGMMFLRLGTLLRLVKGESQRRSTISEDPQLKKLVCCESTLGTEVAFVAARAAWSTQSWVTA